RASAWRPACARRGVGARRPARAEPVAPRRSDASRRRSSRSAASAAHRPVAADSGRAAARRGSRPASPQAPCRAGRSNALPSPPRSAGTSSPLIGLPREESRCLLQNLPLLLQHPHLPPQPTQLLPLLARQPLPLAAVDLGLRR